MSHQRSFGPLEQGHILRSSDGVMLKWMFCVKKRIHARRTDTLVQGIEKDKSQELFAIYETHGRQKLLIGYCGLTNIDREHRRAEVSFLVATTRTNDLKVYGEDMYNALAFLADHAFRTRKFKRLFTETYAFRKEHISFLEQFGFKREGVLRSHILFKGKFRDSIMHGLLNEDATYKIKKQGG